jgi:hypothetical protein
MNKGPARFDLHSDSLKKGEIDPGTSTTIEHSSQKSQKFFIPS